MIQFLVIINPRTNITPKIAPIVAELSFRLEKTDSNTAVNATTLKPADAAPNKGFIELYLVMNSMITTNNIKANSAIELFTTLIKKKHITATAIKDQP
ncbi:hypothetical protein [Lysinibacillus sp. NPDC056185]|uniref:hypothetical protein n=1 Tax=Lysinibacillus sp. NPDC056185 TaxID=3345739 RepID=UPI0039F0D1EB